MKGALRPGAWFAFIDANAGYWRTFPDHASVVRWLLEFNAHRRDQGARGLPLFDGEMPQHIVAMVNTLR